MSQRTLWSCDGCKKEEAKPEPFPLKIQHPIPNGDYLSFCGWACVVEWAQGKQVNP